MGRLKLDTQDVVATYNQFDANACELGRKLLKQVKHREPGWQEAAA